MMVKKVKKKKRAKRRVNLPAKIARNQSRLRKVKKKKKSEFFSIVFYMIALVDELASLLYTYISTYNPHIYR